MAMKQLFADFPELGFAIKESSIRSWKAKYQMEIQQKCEAGETDLSMKVFKETRMTSTTWGKDRRGGNELYQCCTSGRWSGNFCHCYGCCNSHCEKA